MTLARSRAQLRDRATRYLRRRTFNGSSLRQHLTRLEELGEVAVFGGFLRDMTLFGASGFRSDVDIVIDCSPTALDEEVRVGFAGSDVHQNKFGGYRVRHNQDQLDIWPLCRTWAIREKHAPESLKELPSTTFFNWDAILYASRTGELRHADDYFETVHARLLDLNLRPNPNPLGMCVRTLRMMRRTNAKLSRSLAAYVVEVGADSADLCVYESRAFQDHVLDSTFTKYCLTEMKRFLDSHRESFEFDLQVQLSL